jgi:hypothetical protein
LKVQSVNASGSALALLHFVRTDGQVQCDCDTTAG